MGAIPNSVNYRWTKQDVKRAQEGRTRLTPYRLPLSAFSDPKATEVGTSVPLQLDQFASLPSVNRFDLGDDFDWDLVPPELASVKTLAELCAKLNAKANPKYAARFYDLQSMSPEEKERVALLLIEFWQNTDYRYALIAAGKFNGEGFEFSNDPLSVIPTSASYTNGSNERVVESIKYIPVAKAGARSGAAAPGSTSQVVKLPDPDLALLDADIAEMRMTVMRLKELLQKSRDLIKERMLCASRFTALRVLLQTCANASQSAPAANDLAAKAYELEKKSHDLLRNLSTADLLRRSGNDAALVKVFRNQIGLYDNLAEGVESLRDRLCAKLTKDTAFAERCGTFARSVIEKKLQSSPEYDKKRERIILSLVEVAVVLQETNTNAEFSAKLLQILDKAPESPVDTLGGLQEGTALDRLFSLLGTHSFYGLAYAKVVGAATQLAGSVAAGNLAGPANAYIAFVQLRAWQAAEKNLEKAVAGDAAAIDAYLFETIEHLGKGLPPKGGLRAKLKAAYVNKDQDALRSIKKELLDEFSGTFQASHGAKGGALALQLVSFFIAYAVYSKDRQDSNGPGGDRRVPVVDFLNLMGQGAMLVVGSVDVLVTMIKSFAPCARAVGVVGMGAGLFASALGLLASFDQLSLATDAVSTVAALSAVGGNALTTVASVCWLAGVPIPGVQTVGMVLLCVGGVIGLAQAVVDASKPKTALLAGAVLGAIEASAWCTALCMDPAFAKEMEALHKGCDRAILPSPQKNDFVYYTLTRAGFKREMIDMIVAPVGATILPAGTFT